MVPIVQLTEIRTTMCIVLPRAGVVLSASRVLTLLLARYDFPPPHFLEKEIETQKLSNSAKVTCKWLIKGRTRTHTSAVLSHGLLTTMLKCEEIVFIM